MIPGNQKARWKDRLDALVDRRAADTDAIYAAQVSAFRSWLILADMAMKDEEVSSEVIERVLNRMVYGTPYGADAYARIERNDQILHRMRSAPPTPMVVPHTQWCGQEGRHPGHDWQEATFTQGLVLRHCNGRRQPTTDP